MAVNVAGRKWRQLWFYGFIWSVIFIWPSQVFTVPLSRVHFTLIQKYLSKTELTKTYSISRMHQCHWDCCVSPPASCASLYSHIYRPRVCKQAWNSKNSYWACFSVTFCTKSHFWPVWTSISEEQVGYIAEAGPCLLFSDCISGGARTESEHPKPNGYLNY